MVLKDYKCLAHGFFEAWEPRCPKGCDGEAVMVAFLKPVGTRSEGTVHADNTLRGLANDYNMTDIKSVREGESQPGLQARQQNQNPFAIQWGNPQQITGYDLRPIADESVNGLELAKQTGQINPLKPSFVQRDHENLSIQK